MARKSRKNIPTVVGSATVQTEVRRPFRAGLYARISMETEETLERGTIETQVELMKNFVADTEDISAAAGKGHHLKYFSLRISASDPLYIADIPFIHTNKIIIPIIIRPGHLSRMMPLTSYSRLSKLRPCSTMNRVTDLFRGCGSG